RDELTAATLGVLDDRRASSDAGALGLVRVIWRDDMLATTAQRADYAAAATRGEATGIGAPELVLANEWDGRAYGALPARGIDVLAALAADTGHGTDSLVIVPGPRLPVIASYDARTDGEPARLLINPIALAVLEPVADEIAIA